MGRQAFSSKTKAMVTQDPGLAAENAYVMRAPHRAVRTKIQAHSESFVTGYQDASIMPTTTAVSSRSRNIGRRDAGIDPSTVARLANI
jgi:hypothetical protein